MAEVALSGGSSRGTPHSAQRLQLAGLLLFVLVVGNAYSGQLLGFLAAPPRFPELDTIEEVEEAVDKVLLPPAMVRDFFPQLGHSKRLAAKAYNHLGDLANIKEQGNTSLVISELELGVFGFMPNLTHDGQLMLHQAAECLLSPGHIGLLVARDSPIYDLVNGFVLRCVEAGLPAQWLRAQRRRMVVQGVLVHGDAAQEPQKLHVAQLDGPLLCLGAGLGVAALVWGAEVLWRCRWCTRSGGEWWRWACWWAARKEAAAGAARGSVSSAAAVPGGGAGRGEADMERGDAVPAQRLLSPVPHDSLPPPPQTPPTVSQLQRDLAGETAPLSADTPSPELACN